MTDANANYVEIDYVDYGVQGEYGFFGKVVAKSILAGPKTEAEIAKEIAEMKADLGDHCVAILVEVVPATV